MQGSFDFTAGGMQRALDHADLVHSNWSDEAFRFIEAFISCNAGEFMAEDVRASAEGIIAEPPTARAWGGLFNRAAIKGLIVRVGYRKVKNKKAHSTPAAVWKRK